jgi:hypothetical protein
MSVASISGIRAWAAIAPVCALALGPGLAHAITGATPTNSFAAVGAGVQIAPDWVMSVWHYAAQPGGFYGNGYGGREVAARYDAPGSGSFPANDFTLLRLKPLDGPAVPNVAVSSSFVPDGHLMPWDVTLASGANAGPARGYATTQVTEAASQYELTPGNPASAVTVNWLVSMDKVVHVQGGDSGSAMFAGQITDTGVLIGIASALLSDDATGEALGSAYVQPAAYKDWIDATMLADTADGQAVAWSALPLPVPVPEPGGAAMAAAGLAVLATRLARGLAGRFGRRRQNA